MKRILAIDYGQKRLGLALSDIMQMIASPLGILEAAKSLDSTVLKLSEHIRSIEKEKGSPIEMIVVGMPYRLNGEMSLMGDEVQEFVEKLKNQIDIPVLTWDERLTSLQAERSMREANFNRKKRAKLVDQTAATIILQNYLDSKAPTFH